MWVRLMSMYIPDQYSSLEDTKLIKIARTGNYDALLCLLVRYIPLVKSRCGFFLKNKAEFEDFYQEGMVGLFYAVRSFKEDATAFPAFAKVCIDRALISYLRSMQKKSTIPAENLLPLEEQWAYVSDDHDPQEVLIAKEDVKKLNSKLKTKLSELEYSIISHYLNGESYQIISQRLSIPEKSVDNALQRIRRKLKQ